jgi:hypothetical protein
MPHTHASDFSASTAVAQNSMEKRQTFSVVVPSIISLMRSQRLHADAAMKQDAPCEPCVIACTRLHTEAAQRLTEHVLRVGPRSRQEGGRHAQADCCQVGPKLSLGEAEPNRRGGAANASVVLAICHIGNLVDWQSGILAS